MSATSPPSSPPSSSPSSSCAASTALVLDGVSQHFDSAAATGLQVLDNASLTLQRGEKVALSAPSGSGKSTVLHIAALLAKPSAGKVTLAGLSLDPHKRSFQERASRLRARSVGFVYQFHHLLEEFSALDNVALAARIAGASPDEARSRAEDILRRVALRDRLAHRPNQLSGGERQRVAIARALVNDPMLLLADEPTGNLDAKLRLSVFDLMMEMSEQRAVLVATHDEKLVRGVKRRITLRNKKIVPA